MFKVGKFKVDKFKVDKVNAFFFALITQLSTVTLLTFLYFISNQYAKITILLKKCRFYAA
jgi:hypothetical protein